MKLISYEFRKLTGVRYLWLILALLVAGNIVVSYFTAVKTRPRGIETSQIAEFYEKYSADPDAMNAYYADMLDFNRQQDDLFIEAMREGKDYNPERWVNQYGTDEFGDRALFAMVFLSVDATKQYSSDIGKVIRSAEANLAELEYAGVPAGDYACRSQAECVRVYQYVRENVDIKFEYIRGWNEYFGYDAVNVFIFMALILFASVIFTQERVNGFLPVLRTCRRGRVTTALVKCGLMAFIALGTVLLFTVTTFAVFGAVLGYSSPGNAIQALSSYTYCPYLLTIGEYFAVTLGLRLLTFVTFSGVILFISVFAAQYLCVYAAGLGVAGVNFLLYSLVRINSNSLVRNLNFFAAAAAQPLFVRFRTFSLFSCPCSYVPFLLCVFGTLLILGTAGTVTAFALRKGGAASSPRRLLSRTSIQRLVQRVKRDRSASHGGAQRIRQRSLSLVGYEHHKLLIASRMMAVVVAALCLRCVISYNGNVPPDDSFERIYRTYMTALEGEITDEKREYIAKESEFISKTLAMQDTMYADYAGGRIDYPTYSAYLADYNYAMSHSEAIKVVSEHMNYIDKCKAETGIDAWFVYDSGWLRLFGTDADILLLAAVVVLLAGVFADEYSSRSSSGGFAQILRCTKRGRRQTFAAKLVAAVIIAAVTTVLFNAADALIISKRFFLPAYYAPVQSLELFDGFTAGISILEYTAVMYVIRLCAAVTLALLVCGLSCVLGRQLSVLSCVVALTLLPSLLAYFGLYVMRRVDFLRYFAGTPLCIDSIAACGRLDVVAIFALASSALAALTTATAARKFC